MQPSLLVRFGKYLQHRPNFMKVAAATFGVPFAVAVLWMFGAYGGPSWWLLLVAVALATGWFWAYFMWFAVEKEIRRSSSRSAAQNVNEGTRE